MNNSMDKIKVGMGKVAYQITKANVNSACALVLYQPKLTESMQKLRKF